VGDDTLRNESLRYFSQAWNAVLADMRSSDLLSNSELRLLKFNEWEGGPFTRCTYLPTFCTAGKLTEAFNTARVLAVQADNQSLAKRASLERQLHAEVGGDFETRVGVVEFAEFSTWMVRAVLGPRHAPTVDRIIGKLHAYVQHGQLLDGLTPSSLPKLSTALVELAKVLLGVKLAPKPDDAETPPPPALATDTNVGKITDKLRTVLDALKGTLSSASKEIGNDLESVKFTNAGLFWDEEYARSQVLRTVQDPQCHATLQGLVALCSTAAVDVLPAHWEVQRRLCFFVGSLFMNMPRPPPVANMHSWSVLTPFYAEDLLYSAKELAIKNEDGVSVLYFLKTVHPDEWRNFLERMGVSDETKLWKDRKLALELRLWASFRGQTLARTVEGMMLNERALRLLASWEGKRDEALEAIVRQ